MIGSMVGDMHYALLDSISGETNGVVSFHAFKVSVYIVPHINVLVFGCIGVKCCVPQTANWPAYACSNKVARTIIFFSLEPFYRYVHLHSSVDVIRFAASQPYSYVHHPGDGHLARGS